MMALPYNQSQGGSLKKYHGENFNSDVKDIIILNFVSKNDKYLKMRETINSADADILKELNIIAAKCAKYANDNFTDMAKLIYENGIKNEFHVRCDGTTNHTGTKTDVSILENGGLKKKINLSIKGNSAKLHNHTVTKLNTFNQINDIFESAGMKLTMHESEYEHELLHGNILTAVSKLMRSVSPKLVDKSKLVDFMLHATFRHEQNIFFVNFKKAEYKMTDRTKLRQTLTTVLEGETIIKQNDPHVKPDIKVFILDDGTTSKDTKFCGLRLDMTKDGLAIFVEKGEQF
jgi:hypothetical protein